MNIPADYLIFYLLILMAAMIGLYGFSRFDWPLKLIAIYIISSSVFETINMYNGYVASPRQNTISWMNVFILFEGTFFLLYFRSIISHKLTKQLTLGALGGVFALWLYRASIDGIYDTFFIKQLGFAHFILLLFAFIHFRQLLESLQQKRIEFIPYFWINFGILLCVVVGIMAVFSYWYFPKGSEIRTTVWVLMLYSRMLLAIFISLGFIIHLRYGRN